MSRDHMEGAQFGSTFSCASAASLILPRSHVQALKESAARALDFVHPKSGNVGKLRFAADGWQEIETSFHESNAENSEP